MNTWLTSDLHFGHTNIVSYSQRPFKDEYTMTEGIIERYNEVVKPEDTVWLLGDICMGQLELTIRHIGRLNGLKILYPGNHDIVHPRHKRHKNTELAKEFLKSFAVVHHHESKPWLDGPGGVLCRLSHYPVEWEGWSLHGHVHELWRQRGRKINVGVDVWDYRPVHVDEVMALVAAGERNLDRFGNLLTGVIIDRRQASAPSGP